MENQESRIQKNFRWGLLVVSSAQVSQFKSYVSLLGFIDFKDSVMFARYLFLLLVLFAVLSSVDGRRKKKGKDAETGGRKSQFNKKFDYKDIEKEWLEEDLDQNDEADREYLSRLMGNAPSSKQDLKANFYTVTLKDEYTIEQGHSLANRWPTLLRSGQVKSSTASAIETQQGQIRISIMCNGGWKDKPALQAFILDQEEVMNLEHMGSTYWGKHYEGERIDPKIAAQAAKDARKAAADAEREAKKKKRKKKKAAPTEL